MSDYKIYFANTWEPVKTHIFDGKRQLCSEHSIGPNYPLKERQRVTCKRCIKRGKKLDIISDDGKLKAVENE